MDPPVVKGIGRFVLVDLLMVYELGLCNELDSSMS